jgi:ATP-binding cassette subfamily G (WHITE) protein 2 (SNQ2)
LLSRVGDTLSFALRMNTPAPHARLPKEEGGPPLTPKEYELKSRGELLKVFGLEHTVDTKVGDAYIRGVSGGEKKRVSIAEVVSARAAIQW